MRLPNLLVVAKETIELDIDCFVGEGVKLGSVALWGHLAKIRGHSDCHFISSNLLNMLEDVRYTSRIRLSIVAVRRFDHTALMAMRVSLSIRIDFQKYPSAHGGMYTAVLA